MYKNLQNLGAEGAANRAVNRAMTPQPNARNSSALCWHSAVAT